jgi:ABC-type glycerol-3-phosphate transport system substrate-binding protein
LLRVRCVLLLALIGCGNHAAAPAPAIRFLHTFSPDETELFNAIMIEQGVAVEAKLAPFARGQQVIGEMLSAGTNCPDLIRIDATWLPGLAPQLDAVPERLQHLDWLPEAEGDRTRSIPETIDGLVVVRDAAAPAPADATIGALVAAARAAKHEERKYPLGLRVDGYWFVPWLRAHGGGLEPHSAAAAPGIADGPKDRAGEGDIGAPGDPAAIDALADFAHLFGDVAAEPPPSGNEAPEELRRWTSHDVAYWVTGPWQIGALRDRERLAISELANAPRGGQLLVVPKCAKDPAAGWRLAEVLTSVPVAKRFADAFATVPSTERALAVAPPLVASIYHALVGARSLPNSALTPLLFDDLNPAIAAAVAGDATPAEAIEGVRRGWQRLQEHP